MMHALRDCRAAVLVAFVATAAPAMAQPALVSHVPGQQVFNQPPGVTGREPEVVREDEVVDLWLKIGPSFSYNRVFIYYTIDGTAPSGANGVAGNPSTRVMASFPRSFPTIPQEVFFQYNQNNGFGGNDDWWKATVPLIGMSPANSRDAGVTVRYLVSAQQNVGGPEVFANSGQPYAYTVKLPWPGAGAGQPNPSAGYPPVRFWKEEAIFGNTYTSGMIDQNGTVYDFHFPTTGGINGVGTRNEGYVGGNDTFPPNLPSGWRGQMHVNQAMVGIRTPFDGVTHWLSNPNGVSYSDVDQAYKPTSNSVVTTQRLTANGNNIAIEQTDFSPIGITFPNDDAGNPQRHIYLKRMTLTNNSGSEQAVDVYWYIDPALNGGDTYDAMFVDTARGAMVAFDNTFRNVTGTGIGFTSPNEYNPTTFGGYDKNHSLYMASAMKVTPAGGGLPYRATDFWRDTSGDNGQGWMGARVTLPIGQPVTVDIMMVGVHDAFAGASGTYAFKGENVVEWFNTTNMGPVLTATDTYWADWLAAGVTLDSPEESYDELFRRGLLATALHQSAETGAIIAGFHNGAYPYAWPRDAMWAAVTLARAGHLPEAANSLRWMRDICYRDVEPFFGNNPITGQPHKGFWKQKYSTDGYTIWGAPQIDGTAVYPWALAWYYDMTGDSAFINSHYASVWDAVAAMTRDSIDNRLRFEDSVNLMYTNNLWEDSYDVFIYSNANVVRGLRDSARLASILGRPGDAATFNSLANTILNGLNARLDWNGENCDSSQLGIVYPWETHSPTDPRATKVMDRINGVATDRFGNNQPLVNFAGFFNDGYGWTNLINRYWNDTYWGNPFNSSTPWGAGPWYLTTMWYGMFYAYRADLTPGTGDIDNHKFRLDLLIDRLGPVGFGAEQIAPRGIPGQPSPWNVGSLMYPGQNDFQLQTAWPNAWESMSFFVDSLMAFLDFTPSAGTNSFKIEPKLPSDWATMTFKGVELMNAKYDITVTNDENAKTVTVTYLNVAGPGVAGELVARIPSGQAARFGVCSLTVNGLPLQPVTDYTVDTATGRVTILNPIALAVGTGQSTTVVIAYDISADVNTDGIVDLADFFQFLNDFDVTAPGADIDGVPGVDLGDFFQFLNSFDASCA